MDGAAATSLTETPSRRSGLEVCHAGSGYDLWLVALAAGSAAPSITASDRDVSLAPGETVFLAYAESIDVWARCSSGGSGSVSVVVKEVAE